MFEFGFQLGPVAGPIALAVLALLVVLVYAKSVYKNAGPDEFLLEAECYECRWYPLALTKWMSIGKFRESGRRRP